MYNIEFSKKAAKFLADIPKNEFNNINEKLKLLKENPYRNDLDIKKLSAKKDAFRLRVGKIRILYSIIKDKILILVFDAGFRGDIYK